jgi:hypothetical protein
MDKGLSVRDLLRPVVMIEIPDHRHSPATRVDMVRRRQTTVIRMSCPSIPRSKPYAIIGAAVRPFCWGGIAPIGKCPL